MIFTYIHNMMKTLNENDNYSRGLIDSLLIRLGVVHDHTYNIDNTIYDNLTQIATQASFLSIFHNKENFIGFLNILRECEQRYFKIKGISPHRPSNCLLLMGLQNTYENS